MNDKNDDQMVRVHTLENSFEADQLGEILKQEGITFWIKSYSDTAYDGIYVSTKGWGALWVPANREQEVRKIIEDFLSTFSGKHGT